MKRKSKESMKLSKDKKDKRWGLLFLVVLFVLYFSLVALYSSNIPVGKGVDEEAHFLYVEDILKSGHLPKLNIPHGGHYESHQPPLFYILSLPIAYLCGENWRVWGRIFSAILIALSGYICYLAGRRLFKREFLAIASGAFVLLLPGNILIASGFTNDSLVQALFSLAIFFLLGEKERDWLLGGLATAGAIMAKLSVIILIPAVFLAFLLSLKNKGDWRKEINKLLLFFLPIVLIDSWWFVRNMILYGDFLGWRVFQEAFASSPHPSYFLERGYSWGGYWLLVFVTCFGSFWTPLLKFRFLPTGYYIIPAICLLLAIWGDIKWIKKEEKDKAAKIYLLVFSFFLLFLSFIRFNLYFFEAQGRYLYPAICAFSLLFNGGLEKINRFLPYIFYLYLLPLAFLSLSLL
ncbi:glycosyltransferase family 39 protein [bacterium]|nr:glycosyltransferase family 39 protein [bacterium]